LPERFWLLRRYTVGTRWCERIDTKKWTDAPWRRRGTCSEKKIAP
jgi:hypothetical protein